MASLSTCVTNFPSKHYGKTLALIDGTLNGLSPAVLAVVYSLWFSNDNYEDAEKQNAQGFVLFLALGSLVAGSLCVAFLRHHPYTAAQSTTDPDANERKPIIKKDDTWYKSGDNYLEQSTMDLPIPMRLWNSLQTSTAYIFTLDLQCSMWSFSFLAVVGGIFYHNCTVILVSNGFNEYIPLITIIVPIILFGSTLLTSFASDYFVEKFPRIFYVLAIGVMFAITQLLLAYKSDDIYVIILALSIIGGCISFLWVLVMAIVTELIGVRNFNRNWGTIMFHYSIIEFVSFYVFGALYDRHVHSGNRCYGKACFFWTFIMLFIMSCVALIFIVVSLIRRQKT